MYLPTHPLLTSLLLVHHSCIGYPHCLPPFLQQAHLKGSLVAGSINIPSKSHQQGQVFWVKGTVLDLRLISELPNVRKMANMKSTKRHIFHTPYDYLECMHNTI